MDLVVFEEMHSVMRNYCVNDVIVSLLNKLNEDFQIPIYFNAVNHLEHAHYNVTFGI